VSEKHLYSPIVNRKSIPQESKMTKAEIDTISRALRNKVKAAATAINALAPKLKAEFELQLVTEYPSCGDPVWADALNEVRKCYEIQRARVEARSKELKIPERFWPHLMPPSWTSHYSDCTPDFKDYRAEMRRLAHIQIDEVIQSRLVQLEVDSANIQFELAAHGCITDAANEFLARLPSIEALIPKLTVSEVEGLIEGRAIKTPLPQLNEPAKLLQLPPSDEQSS
jgi:hypothetical protein